MKCYEFVKTICINNVHNRMIKIRKMTSEMACLSARGQEKPGSYN